MMIQLDPQQKEAVYTDSGRALVLAGAGSGKTRVLVERIAHLIENKNVSPTEILALTFTRKAASEMRSRLEARIGGAANRISIGTIHATALKLLHRFGDLIGMKPRNITVYGEFEEQYLLREIAIDLGIYNGKAWKVKKRDIDAMLNRYYSRGEEPTEEHPGYKLFRDLLDRMRENNSLSYGQLLIAMRRLIPLIAPYMHWKHIFCDEVQDNDRLQWEILKMCSAFGAALFVVGDVSQSIYVFRGAVPSYLVYHQHEFDFYRLESNYRSLPKIVEAANRLIEHNEMRLRLTMRATRETQPGPIVLTLESMDSSCIAGFCKGLNEADTPPQAIAVLSRMHVLLEKLSEELTTLGVPHVKIGRKTELTNSEEFRRFHAFLKLIANPYDNFAFMLIRELVGIPREFYNNIRLFASQNNCSHYQAWLSCEKETDSPFANLYSYFEESKESSFETLSLGQAFTHLGLIMKHGTEYQQFTSTFRFVQDWLEQQPNGDGTVAEYLDWLATWDIQEEIANEENKDKVTLCTIHAAKGLEFPVVIVAGCNEGILPSKRAVSAGDIEEERRLMYVAATRAEDRLIITVRPETEDSPRSRFIGEM